MLGSNHKIYWATLKSTWKQNGIHGSTRTAERSWVKKIAFLLRVACLRECFWQKMRISFYMFKDNVVWNLSLRANPQKKCGEQSHASTKWSIAKAETMILQDRSGMEGGEQKRLVHLGEDLNHKLVMAGLGSAENECKKPWRQWAKMKKQTWPDPWNNQISQAVPMDYGHWNSSKQKKQFANTSCLIENVSTEQRSAFIKIKWAARLLIPTVSYKAWNQNSVSQQNSLGTRTKIVKQQAFKTWHAPTSKECWTKKRRMKHSNDFAGQRAATIAKNVSCHACPSWQRKNSPCSMEHAWQPLNKTANVYICHICRI